MKRTSKPSQERLPRFSLWHYLRERQILLFALIIVLGLELILGLLFKWPIKFLLYLISLQIFTLLAGLIYDYLKRRRDFWQWTSLLTSATALDSFSGYALSVEVIYLLRLLIAEQERQRREELSRLAHEREVRDYFVIWLHRIKTPLSVLTLQMDLGEKMQIEVVERNLELLDRYAKLALSYVQLSSSGEGLRVERLDLKELLEDLIERQRDFQVAQAVELDLDVSSLLILSDPMRLSMALEQFLSNAYKYGAHGRVSIELRAAKLTISDQGPGIPPEYLQKVRQFGFAGSGREYLQQSSGLGLYIADQFLRLLAVPYELNSRPGEGLTVTVDFSEHLFEDDKNVTLYD